MWNITAGGLAAGARKQLKDKNSDFRKQILRQFIDGIEGQDDKILIKGSKKS